MTDHMTTWDDVRQLADEIELQIHLGTMESRDRWAHLKPRVEDVERQLVHVGTHVTAPLVHELVQLKAALQKLRDALILKARSDYVTGW